MIDYQEQMNEIKNERRQLRKIERRFRRNFLEEKPMVENTLRAKLASVLPAYMIPGNVGDIDKVTWPYWFPVTFDFGANPTWTSATRQVQSFQVTQEAGFLLMALGRKVWDSTNAGNLAPLQVEIRDRQSSRQFNDRPIPIQNIGLRHQPTIFSTSLFIMPNAFIDFTMTSFVAAGENMPTISAASKHEIVCFGYRIRAEKLSNVLSTIYG